MHQAWGKDRQLVSGFHLSFTGSRFRFGRVHLFFLTIIVKYSPYLCTINKNKETMSKSEKIAASLRIADNMMHRASTGSDFEKLSEMMSDEMLKLIDEMGLVLA